jgi:hypothetical protein
MLTQLETKYSLGINVARVFDRWIILFCLCVCTAMFYIWIILFPDDLGSLQRTLRCPKWLANNIDNGYGDACSLNKE